MYNGAKSKFQKELASSNKKGTPSGAFSYTYMVEEAISNVKNTMSTMSHTHPEYSKLDEQLKHLTEQLAYLKYVPESGPRRKFKFNLNGNTKQEAPLLQGDTIIPGLPYQSPPYYRIKPNPEPTNLKQPGRSLFKVRPAPKLEGILNDRMYGLSHDERLKFLDPYHLDEPEEVDADSTAHEFPNEQPYKKRREELQMLRTKGLLPSHVYERHVKEHHELELEKLCIKIDE